MCFYWKKLIPVQIEKRVLRMEPNMAVAANIKKRNYFAHTAAMLQRWIIEIKKIVAIIVFRLYRLKLSIVVAIAIFRLCDLKPY